MLYIAEVKKQTKLFMGGLKTILHLRACQQNDNRWSAIPGEEIVSTDDITQPFGEGALVTVNLGANRQVQGNLELAGAKVATLLQNLSRKVEKTKGQEDEIESWKASLTAQAQEINRRREELEQLEIQLAEQETQFAQIEQERAELEQLRSQWERDRSELQGAWEQLRGQQQLLERRQEELQGKQGLNPEQTESLRALVEQVEGAIAAAETTLTPLNQLQDLAKRGTEEIQSQWKILDRDREQAEQNQREANELERQLKTLHQQYQEKQKALLNNQKNLARVESQLETKQQIVTYLGTQLQKQSEARDILSRLVIDSPQLKIQQEVDIQSLEEMPLEQLEREFNGMKKSFQDAVSFVKDQEEELDYQLDSVRELEEQLQKASGEEKENIKNELAEEQDRYRYLEKTLVGQRRNLMAREDILEQHQKVLKRRQGEDEEEEAFPKVDLSPIFNKIDSQRDYSEDEFHQANDEVESVKSELKQLEQTVKQQEEEVERLRENIANSEATWQQLQKQANELYTRVEVNGGILQEREEEFQQLSDRLQEIDYQLQVISSQEQKEQLLEIQRLLDNL